MINGTMFGVIALAMLSRGGTSLDLARMPSPPGAIGALEHPLRRDTTRAATKTDTLSDGRRRGDTSAILAPDSLDDRSHWLRDFDRRSTSNKLGYFLNEQQIQASHPQYTSDALRRVPGIVVLPARGIGNAVRIRGCAPLIWVDGQRAPGVELDEVTHGSDVAAMEVYRSLAGVPAEFTDRSAICGTILVWLKSD